MLEIPEDIQHLLSLISRIPEGTKQAAFAYRLLFSAIERHGMRWEYFI